MKNIKKQKGITLIALVITIIVMLILVGVTISMALNGKLFGYAKKATKDTKEALEHESSLTEGIINGQTIDDIVGTVVADNWYGTPAEELKTDTDGNYHISTCAELAKFAEMVNEGNDFEGKKVYLEKNLDLQGNESKQWTPIGVFWDKPFNGTFNGKNHYISGIYIDNEDDNENTYYGLFGNIISGDIENLGVTKGYIKSNGNNYIGGIIGSFENKAGYIKNCYNTCTIIGIGVDSGGIAGCTYGTIENCYNTGKITGTETDGVGGIVGNAGCGNVEQCYNSGEVIAETEADYAGGIVGWSEEGELLIANCYNKGKIVSKKYSGGIVGCIYDGITRIRRCYNIGELTGAIKGEIAGGSFAPILNCYFLSSSKNKAVGENPENATVGATAKTETEMKTDEFVTLLNNGSTIWKKDTGINNGYPILSWQ